MGKQKKIKKCVRKVKYVIHFNLLIAYNLECQLRKIVKHSGLEDTMIF